ncbi:MAG: thiamine phosphate synthase [bacterium]|jgi:thiamine-phosphate pyrophosphorylase
MNTAPKSWLNDARLWMITDTAAARGRAIPELVAQGVAGGVDVVVVRFKELSGPPFISAARPIAAICRDLGVPWVLSHNLDLVSALDPDGVHLGAGDPTIAEARAQLARNAVIGYSAHTIGEIGRVKAAGADYAWFSPIYPTKKDGKAVFGIGVESARRALETAGDFPLVFLGGVNADNAHELAAIGGTRIAAIGAIIGADDVESAARKLKAALSGES